MDSCWWWYSRHINCGNFDKRRSFSCAKKNKNYIIIVKEFRWVHTGSLYTLVKDQMKTLKYILGSLDDLLEFYSSFKNMNLMPSEKGLHINQNKNGWFNKNYIDFKYRLKNRKFFLNWIFSISRSIALEGIKARLAQKTGWY